MGVRALNSSCLRNMGVPGNGLRASSDGRLVADLGVFRAGSVGLVVVVVVVAAVVVVVVVDVCEPVEMAAGGMAASWSSRRRTCSCPCRGRCRRRRRGGGGEGDQERRRTRPSDTLRISRVWGSRQPSAGRGAVSGRERTSERRTDRGTNERTNDRTSNGKHDPGGGRECI